MNKKFKRIKAYRQPIDVFCRCCGKRLLASDLPGYSAVCIFCDENFYKIEYGYKKGK